MPYISLKQFEEQIPKHLSPRVKALMLRHLRDEHLKNLEKPQDKEK